MQTGLHWQDVWERFDPLDPETAAARGWVARRPRDASWHLDDKLARPVGQRRYLVHGTVGTGKTTELLQLLSGHDRDYVGVYFNVHDHFSKVVRDTDALRRVESWEIVFLIGVALVRAAQEAFDHHWNKADLDRIKGAHEKLAGGASEEKRADVDIVQLARALAVSVAVAADATTAGALTAVTALSASVRWQLPIGLGQQASRPDQDPAVLELLDAVNTVVSTLESEYRPVLLVLDGLDRLGTDRAAMERLLVRSSLLSRLEFRATVVAGPVTVRRGGYGARIHSFESVPVTNVPVLAQDDPGQHGPGIAFFRELYDRRVADLRLPTGILAPAMLDRLAYYSGGLVREFVRFVREVADDLWRVADAATDDVIDTVIDRRRRTYEQGLDRGHIELLRQVMEDPDHDLPAEGRDRVDQLLDRFALLPYPNESEWYYPHPLLTLSKLKTESAG